MHENWISAGSFGDTVNTSRDFKKRDWIAGHEMKACNIHNALYHIVQIVEHALRNNIFYRPYLRKLYVLVYIHSVNKRYTNFCNSHSLLSKGHTLRVFNQREIQWKWNACYFDGRGAVVNRKEQEYAVNKERSLLQNVQLTLQIPHAALHSSEVADT